MRQAMRLCDFATIFFGLDCKPCKTGEKIYLGR